MENSSGKGQGRWPTAQLGQEGGAGAGRPRGPVNERVIVWGSGQY